MIFRAESERNPNQRDRPRTRTRTPCIRVPESLLPLLLRAYPDSHASTATTETNT